MSKISIKIGPPVEGDDFYGREKELLNAWEIHLSKGTSLLLSAPRRVGKSSFSKKMLKIAETNGWKTLYLDLEGVKTEDEFVKILIEKTQKEKWWEKAKFNVGDVFLKLLESINGLEVAGNKLSLNSTIWRGSAYGKIRQVFENAEEMLIVIDELTIYFNHLLTQENGKEKVEFFLEWLRNFRQTTKTRWILCSSVGIENFVSMHHLSKHINDVHPFHIGAFSEHEAKDFISRLDVDKKVQFTEEHIQYILDKLVWNLPFFIQIFVEKINFLVCIEGKQLSNDTIDEAYNRLIAESYFNTWDERLEEYYEFEDNARKVLELCALPHGRSRENLLASLSAKKSDVDKTKDILSKLLYMLINDGYLVEDNGKYIFRSPLLRDFWHGRFVK
jgi:adenosyl cobinamide kinase/adenosyl cobinamide phosphate guanylyltransferase